jgi:hypothetical protein
MNFFGGIPLAKTLDSPLMTLVVVQWVMGHDHIEDLKYKKTNINVRESNIIEQPSYDCYFFLETSSASPNFPICSSEYLSPLLHTL